MTYKPYILLFQDPFNPGNDIARASYGMFYVKDSFKFAYRWLKRAIIAPRKPNEQVFPMTDRFLSDSLLT